MDKRIWKPLAMTLAVSAASVSYAHADVDIDNDGLIEISTLQELDLMRYDLAGTSLNGDSTGCPATGCNGYELVADLDFDTNGNGVADDGDLFWNEGKGWVPVGKSGSRYTGTLEGNGHVIRNFYINGSADKFIGLFGATDSAVIRNMTFAGANVKGYEYLAIVAGDAHESTFTNIHFTGMYVEVTRRRGGALIGSGYDNIIVNNVTASGQVKGMRESGGLIGYISANGSTDVGRNQLSNIEYSGTVSGYSQVGPLVGAMYRSDVVGFRVTNSQASASLYQVGGAFGAVTGVTVANGQIESDIASGGWGEAGGLVGHAFNSTFASISFKGNVTSTSYETGGLIGLAGGLVIENTRTEAAVTSQSGTAGLIGVVSQNFNVEISNSLVITTLNGGGSISPLIGSYVNIPTITETYWDSEVSGIYTSDSGEPRTTAELQCPTMPGDVTCDASMYSGWDDTIWDFGTSSDYPVLR